MMIPKISVKVTGSGEKHFYAEKYGSTINQLSDLVIVTCGKELMMAPM